MIYPIVLYKNSILRQKAKEVPFATNIRKLVQDMFETMYSAKGCGLAAPQIGKSIQLFIVEFSPQEDSKPIKRVVINPKIEVNEQAELKIFDEGCLSIPNLLVPIARKESITINFFDENWKKQQEQIDGFLARIILHEYDHLIGKLHIDYATKEYSELITADLDKISRGEVAVSYSTIN
jgi:peptide deformylase